MRGANFFKNQKSLKTMADSIQDYMIWQNALDMYSEKDLNGSLEQFSLISHSSKVQFNMACIYMELQDYTKAIGFFTKAMQRDPYFAIAFYERAFCFVMLKEFERAARDYTQCLQLLLDNAFIHYQTLGLSFVLYKCEILYNRAMCFSQLNQEQESDADIHVAQSFLETQDQIRIIGSSSKSGFQDLTLFTLPIGTFFKVTDTKIKNLEKREHLETPKMIVLPGTVRNSNVLYPGFMGERFQSKKIRPRSVSLPDCADFSLLPQSNRVLGKVKT